MASPQAPQKLRSMLKQVWLNSTTDFSAAAAACAVSEAGVAGTWFAMRDFSHVLALLHLTDRTDNIESFAIYGATDSSGSNAASIVAHADPTGADAASDGVVLEITAEQLAQEGADAGVDYTHIAVYVKTGNTADRVGVVLTGLSKRPRLNLTADYSS